MFPTSFSIRKLRKDECTNKVLIKKRMESKFLLLVKNKTSVTTEESSAFLFYVSMKGDGQ